MHPILIRLGPLTIFSYGVMVALGFGLATFLICINAKKHNLNKNSVIDLFILMLLSGLIGARLFYVLLNIDYYLTNPIEVLNLSRGGLIWYGGFLSGLATAAWYIRRKRIDFWIAADFAIPYIALAQSLGRIGCFLNGCCFGIEASSDFQFGVVFPGSPVLRHPTQIYSSLALLILFIVLRIWQDLPHFKGEIFLGYCVLYSLERFFMEFLRADNPRIISGLTFSQIISAIIFILALTVFVNKDIGWRRYLRSK